MSIEPPNLEDIKTSEEELVSPLNNKDEIETVIASLEDNETAMVLENEEGFLWKFQYGDVEVFVQLTGENTEDLFTVWSVILDLPTKNDLALMEKLLTMNWSTTFETYFAICNNQIVISTQRTVEDLSPAEISRAITLVANIADENKEKLREEFSN